MRTTAALLILVACAGCSSTGAETPKPLAPGEVLVPVRTGARTEEAPPRSEGDAVTHLGRSVFRRCDLIARARVVALDEPLPGTELARLATTDLLAGLAPDGDLRVLCGERGKLPRVGQEGVFFLEIRPRSTSHRLVDVSPLTDKAGAARVAALRAYIEIESRPTRDQRIAALLAYLRRATRAGDRWTRDNAAREYAAVAAWDRSVLEEQDALAMQTARRRTRDPETRKLLDRAYSAVGSRAGPRSASLAGRAAAATAKTKPGGGDATAFERRYLDPAASAGTRRKAVLDAEDALGAGGEPLYERALADEDPTVREAAVVAAARSGVLEPKVAALLNTERVPEVRTSIVRALGLLRSDRSTVSLAALAEQPGPLGREACFALARIRTPDALGRLGAARIATTDSERRDLIDFLLSDAFLEQERRLGQR